MSQLVPVPRKCVVWDLDGTLWKGVLAEGRGVRLRADALALMKLLDERGIVQSIASRNERWPALQKLKELGIAEYFLAPQLGWGAKSDCLRRIAKELGITLNAIAFIDDQQFELDEVKSSIPDVLCVDAADLKVADWPEFRPYWATDESRERRTSYIAEQRRKQEEESFEGPPEAFLQTLDLRMEVNLAEEGDLERILELTERTHQLNSTGRTFSRSEIETLRTSENHLVLIAKLEDRYGSYGRIGLAVIEKTDAEWTLLLLLMSCRVLSRGAGTLLLGVIIRSAQAAGIRMLAEFIPSTFNRVTYIMLKFAGFKVVGTVGERQLLELSPNIPCGVPNYVRISTNGWASENL